MTPAEQLQWIASYATDVPPYTRAARAEPSKTGVLIADAAIEANDSSKTRPLVITVYGANTGIGSIQEGLGAVGGLFFSPASTGQQLEVVSTGAADAAAGTGMRSIRIVYETAAHTIGSEDITLNGTSAVSTTATDIIYVWPQYLHGLGYGTGGVAGGNIDIRIQGGGAVVERILAGRQGVAHSARTRVPPGYTGFIFEWNVGVAGTNAASFNLAHNWDMRTHAHLGAMVSRYQLDSLTSGWSSYELPIPLVLPEHTEIEATAIRLGGTDAAGATTFDLLLIRNS